MVNMSEDETRDNASFRSDHLIFRISNERFALPASSLRQILEPPPIIQIPNTPAFLLGIINLRGEILGVLDLRVHFRLGVAGTANDERLLVLKHKRRSVALVADAVIAIESFETSQLDPVPLDLPDLHRRTFLGQMTLKHGRPVSLIDPASIFNLPQYQVDTKNATVRTHG
jgi:purine-binding chemotaxis protein CheW